RVVAGDFNGDGLLDLAATNSDSVSVLLGRGDSTFQPEVEFPAGTNPSSLASGDFNGDGELDLAAASFDTASDGGPLASQVTILLGRGDGTFETLDTTAEIGAGTFALTA